MKCERRKIMRYVLLIGLLGLVIFPAEIIMGESNLKTGLISFEVKEMPEFHLAFVEHIGPYQEDGALFDFLLNQLVAWAGPKGLFNFPETALIIVYGDESSPDAPPSMRMCIGIPEGTPMPEGIREMTIPGGKHAVGRFEIGNNEFGKAWSLMYGDLIPTHGGRPGPGSAYEIKLNDSDEHPEHKHIVDICIPVELQDSSRVRSAK
jgi:AraC family transcriptional regulator